MPPEGFIVCDLILYLTSAWQVARDAFIQRWIPLSLPNCASSFILLIKNFTRSLGGLLTGPNLNFIQNFLLHLRHEVKSLLKYALFIDTAVKVTSFHAYMYICSV